jgi:hypothetical protein
MGGARPRPVSYARGEAAELLIPNDAPIHQLDDAPLHAVDDIPIMSRHDNRDAPPVDLGE